MLLEICVNDIESAILAQKAGADRIELCANLNEGGITPSFAILEYALKNISIPVFPIIRPRTGNFVYSNVEFEIMINDIKQCLALGFKGVVLGILKNNGDVDVKRTKQLVQTANSMEVTFHRAFDRTNDYKKALKDVMKSGCKRILTSGMYEKAYDGKNIIKELIELAKNKIIIMPGSGIRSNNINAIKNITNATEFHSSAAELKNNKLIYRNKNFLKSDGDYRTVNIEEIKKMKQLINK